MTSATNPPIHHPWHGGECGINRLKCNRAVTARFDELAVRREATLTVAALIERL